ncbi:MAG: hypothetical protein RL274_799 [Pseudomonadota bacterium]
MAKIAAENWLRTNEVEQFVGALEFAAEIVPSTAADNTRWKWVIIALHNALQGACVCALSGADTAGTSYLSEKSGAKMWHWLDVTSRSPAPAHPPNERLSELLILYQRVKDRSYLSEPLKVDDETDRSVDILNNLRNKFTHFISQSWGLELSGLPKIVQSVCDIVEYLALDFSSFNHHYRGGERDRIARSLAVLRLNCVFK